MSPFVHAKRGNMTPLKQKPSGKLELLASVPL